MPDARTPGIRRRWRGAAGDADRIAGDQFRLSGTQRAARFAEQGVLGQIAIEVLTAADATVIDRTGMGGNEEVRQAPENDEIDPYWEYTATGWLVHPSETRSIPDPQEQYEAVRKKDLGVEGVSDLARPVEERPGEATLCFNNDDDFRTRFDGLPGMGRAYGFQFPEGNLIEASAGAVYGAVDEAEICNFGVAFTTSGFIQDLDLKLLGDDKDFFAVYNPSLNIRKSTLDQYPQLERVFAPISKELDTQTLRDLNYAVDVEGESPETVARGGSGTTGLSSSLSAPQPFADRLRC